MSRTLLLHHVHPLFGHGVTRDKSKRGRTDTTSNTSGSKILIFDSNTIITPFHSTLGPHPPPSSTSLFNQKVVPLLSDGTNGISAALPITSRDPRSSFTSGPPSATFIPVLREPSGGPLTHLHTYRSVPLHVEQARCQAR